MKRQCIAQSRSGARCGAIALRDGDKCRIHSMSPDECVQQARRAGLMHSSRAIDLVAMKTPEDAIENIRRLQAAMSRGKLGERLARCHLLAVKLYLDAHGAMDRDAKLQAAVEAAKTRYRRAAERWLQGEVDKLDARCSSCPFKLKTKEG